HAEAERLEHHISEGLEERIAAKLGQPSHDPHGDPIPARDGSMIDIPARPLAACDVGSKARITRVSDRSTALLQYLAQRGLRPGADVSVESVDELGAERHVLSLGVAGQILVEARPACGCWSSAERSSSAARWWPTRSHAGTT